MTTFVVGLDDSESAAHAFRWAVEESRRHGARLIVVHAWHWPYQGDLGTMANDLLATFEFEEASDRVLAEMVRRAHGDRPVDVEIELRVVDAPPAQALLDAAADADLLVVGSRGRGGFKGLLMGSVSQQCAHHASCPVVVVPHPEPPGG